LLLNLWLGEVSSSAVRTAKNLANETDDRDDSSEIARKVEFEPLCRHQF
jgi:hypothetical protein